MKRFLNRIIASLFILLSLLSLFGCKVEYNAVIIDEGITYKTEWLESNRTYGVYYENPSYNPEDEYSENVLTDTTSPKYRTYIVREKSELAEIFSEAPEIDFEKDMLIVCCFTTIYHRKRILERVQLDESNVLQIEFKAKANDGRGDASMPSQGVLVIKMDKLDIENVQVVYNE